jgi:hypothetical protein
MVDDPDFVLCFCTVCARKFTAFPVQIAKSLGV